MSQESIIIALRLFMGGMGILGGLFWKQLSRALGQQPISERFTNPRFQRAARIREFLGRLFFVVFGIAWLVEGLGGWLLPNEVADVIRWSFLGLTALIILAMFGVVIVYWKGEEKGIG